MSSNYPCSLTNPTTSSIFLTFFRHPSSANHSLRVKCARYPSPSLSFSLTSRNSLFFCRSSSSSEEWESDEASAGPVEREDGEGKDEDEWLSKLPDKNKPLYSHSLPCIEAWLRNLGFCQSNEDRAAWFVEKSDWHAKLSLDTIDLCVRYLKSGPGNLEKDVERRFSYALSREDIENAVLGGP